MPDDMRWAARYTFAEALWRGRPRVVFDPLLERALLQDRTTDGGVLSPALADLVDDLLPARRREIEPVWMVVGTAETAADLARSRPGTTFLPLTGLVDVLRRADWDVALLDFDRRALGGLESNVRRVLSDHTERTILLSLAVAEGPGTTEGYDELSTILSEDLGGGRIYAMYLPAMAAVVEYGDPIEAEPHEDADDELEIGRRGSRIFDVELDAPEEDEGDEISGAVGGTDDDVPLTFDNTLGSQEPEIVELIAVSGELDEMSSEGLSLIELPERSAGVGLVAFDFGAHDLVDDDVVGRGQRWGEVRAQLAQALRQADMAAIERQGHLERADALEVENAELRRRIEDLRDRLARAVAHGSSTETGMPGGRDVSPATPLSEPPDRTHGAERSDRLDAALAREQSLRWRVAQLERELEQVVGRPVSELEAEVARLRATITTGRGNVETTRASGEFHVEAALQPATGVFAQNGVVHRMVHPGERALDPGTEAVIRTVDGLVRRLERGGIKTLELRRELVALRRRLRA